MIVYPLNELTRAGSFSITGVQSGFDQRAVLDNWFDYYIQSSGTNIALNAEWPITARAPADTLILGGTGAFRVEIIIGTVTSSINYGNFYLTGDKINIIKLPVIEPVTRLRTTLYREIDNNTFKTCYMFFGRGVDLGLFAVNPVHGFMDTGAASVTKTGQVYGLKGAFLQHFECVFPRIDNDMKNIHKAYAEAVGQIDGHVIDPWPEARDKFPPFYAVLNNTDLSVEKRTENNWKWRSSFSWMEAR
jgi:hypothetical protein